MDAVGLPELTERQERILALIVREYINNPEPVGSKLLAERFLTHLSSATIRNDMAVLEEKGLITAPHTSAGRIPTEMGYRYFVKRLLDERELPHEEQRTIADEFNTVQNDLSQWMQLAASTLARTARGAALVTAPRAINQQYKHLALISTHGRMVMMVLVLYGGEVRQQMLTLAESLPQDTLSNLANHLNAVCEGLNSEQIRYRARNADNELEREILDILADTLSDTRNHPIAYRLTESLPEFGSEGAQQIVRVMEERSLLAGIIAEAGQGDDVRVIIAGDGRWQEVRHVSLVISRYGVTGQTSGTMAVIGPVRMRYSRAISAMRYVTGLMNHLLIDNFGSASSTPNAPTTTTHDE
jgi:heat-inducible transcriptional repressor